ncbi:uncharacterized protein LOC130910324 isoform X5 [Corythoichthys intestinalis]|uniref:uncharacterized protein LOC130910324 isoform X5 n=1 Tax=Corythoichthys intestinalis TaxID=161448 RepID=UPI0025A68968|nr:uncharacterized protein LOC130910324 isoform X5 [Corythoichthys intestinalis]
MTSFFELHFDTKWREGLACQICLTKYKIFAEFKRHISSKEHQKKMTQVFQTESLSPSGKLPRIIVIERDVQLTTQQPLLGLQLLTICFSRTLSKVFYLCHICKENVRDNNILEHLNSNHHRVNYHSNNPDMEQLPCEDMSPSGRKRKLEENSDAGWMGALKILNLPQRLLNLYKDFSYYQAVMKSLDAYKVPKLFEVGSEPKKLRIEEAQRNGPPHPDASEKSYKILCQNCNIEFNTQAQYFQHVENDQHVMWTRSLTRQGNNHSSSNPIELKDPRKAAQSFLSQSLNEGIFNQLDEHSVPGASMMVFCYCSKAKCDPICTCCACQDTFPKDLLKKHLESHKHLLQTLMYLNPWRLPFGWKQVPGRKFLESMVKMEEKERGWSQVVLKVMDLPFSLLNRINPPSFEKVMDELRIHQVVLKRNIPPCQTYSQCFENKTFPILGHNFIVSYECSHPSCDSMYDSLLCLMCGRLLVNQEDYAHVFSWEHVSTFLERFHPGSLTPQCDAKTFLELANKAARIHMVSHMQKIRLDRPIKESCTYDKVKVILGAAKKRGSKGLIIPLILPQAPLETLPSDSSTSTKYMALSATTTLFSSRRVTSMYSSGTASTPKVTATTTCTTKSGNITTFSSGTSTTKKSTAPATVCTAPSSRVAASTTKSTEMNIHDCSTPSTGPGIKTKPVATTVTHGTTKTKTTPVIHDAKSSSLGTAPRTTTNLEATTVIHGAAPIISYPSPTIKDTATNPIHDATTSKLITTASTSSVTSCVVSTLEITAANSDPRTSITVSSSLHKAPKDGTERRIQGSSRTCEKNLSVPSHVVVPTSAEAVVRHRKSLNTDSKQKLYMCHPPSSRPGTSTAKIMNSKTKPTVSKIGQSFIVAVNCSGRKQSYCTLCGIRLDRSSHPTENIHLYNYMKWRFPELTDEQLAGINLEDFIFGMTEVEKCMGLRNFQTIRVTNDEYNHLSELPEAQALQKLKTHFLVSSNTLTALEQVSPASLHGATSPEDALDTEAHASTSTSLTAEPEATVQTTRQGEFSETMSGQQKIDDHDDFAEENPEGLNDSLTSVSLGPESQLNEENDDECSPSVLLGPDLHIGDTDVKDMEESLSSFNEPSPELSLGPEQQIASTGSKDVQDLEGSESGSSLELIEPDTHFSDRELELEDEDLEVSNRASPSSPGPELPPELETGTQNRIVRCKTERESILHDAPIDEGSNVSQVPILGPGNGSNLNSFLWVRYRSKKPIIGLSSVYECCGTLKDSFYLCESCDQKFSLQDICQHIVSDEHQLKYMLRAYPHLLDSFWYDEDLMQEMKLDILNDVIVKIAAQERSKNSDAKVVFLCQDMYESVWNAPFAEALDMLQHGTFQPGVSSQQNENRASEQQSGQTKDLPVDMNADSVPASSSARTSFGAQKTCTSSHIPTQPSILSPVCSTSPPFQMKVEQMDMQYKPPENLVSVTKAPYFVQVKNEPMSWQVQPHERPSPISKDQPSLEVKAVTMPQEHETAKAISEEQLHFKVKDKPKPQVSETTKAIPEKQIEDIKSAFPLKPKSKSAGRTFETHPSFEWIFEPVSSESDSGEPAGVIFEKCSYHTKAEHLPSESASFETVDPVFEGQPRYQIKAVLMPSESESFKTAGPKFNEQPSFDWIFEPVSSESESGETAGPIFEKHSYRAKAEPLPSVSESFETADHLKAGLMPSESEPFETAGPIYMEQPGFQMKAEPMPQECQGHGTADPVLEEFQMPNIFQIKDGVALLPLGSPVTATQGTDNVPSSQVKAEIVLLEDISPFSIGCISKTQPSSQRKHDLICPESTPVTKMPSSFHVEEAFPKDVTSSTLGPTISEEEYLPTKKRASLESLDDLIRICTNKTQNIDFRPVKCKRKSMETHPPPFSGNLAPGDHSGSVIQETNSSLKKCHPKAVDGIAVSTSQPIAQGSNLMSVQPINVTRNSRWDSKTLKSPSTRQGIQCVTADLPPARSSPQECSMIKSQSAVPGMQCVMPDPPPASVIQETNSSSKKCPPKAVDGIVVSTSHPIAQGSNLMSVQPINVASKSRWDSKTLKSPSTRQGIQSVTQDPPPARSSPQECSMIMTDNSTNTVVSREPNLFKTEKPQLANISQSSIPEQTEVLQCHTILENRVQYDCKLDKDHRQMAAPQGNTNTVELSENRVNCNLDRAHREMLTGAMAGPSESQLSSSGSHIPFVSQVNSESAPIALTTDHRTAGSHSLGKNNVEESSALQFHFPQGANHFTMPFLGHYPSAMGWMNQPSQQWLQHQQYSLPWVQNTVNWTNDPNYLCNFSFATALYPGHILPPVPSGGQGNVSFSQPSKAQFSKNK